MNFIVVCGKDCNLYNLPIRLLVAKWEFLFCPTGLPGTAVGHDRGTVTPGTTITIVEGALHPHSTLLRILKFSSNRWCWHPTMKSFAAKTLPRWRVRALCRLLSAPLVKRLNLWRRFPPAV
uniref:Uncharacterized protein n=1 Tax=Schistocephalus solidus TaxID=70667 RepID=A0A0X3PR51_SCHSO